MAIQGDFKGLNVVAGGRRGLKNWGDVIYGWYLIAHAQVDNIVNPLHFFKVNLEYCLETTVFRIVDSNQWL